MKPHYAILTAIVLALFVVIGLQLIEKSVAMHYTLRNVESSFLTTATHPTRVIEKFDGERIVRVLDYAGRIDSIIARRDSILDAHGYLMLGLWDTHTYDGKTIGHVRAWYIPWFGGHK